MKLISESVFENVSLLTEEAKDGKKNYFIEGVFMQADTPNRNGRIYPLEILKKEADRFNEDFVKPGRALGELSHADNSVVNLERVSHRIKELKQVGSDFHGKAKILDTPYGKIVKSLIDEGINLGVSTRGMGSVMPIAHGINEVQGDFFLVTVDIVHDPSAPDAFVNGILENKEWVWENGVIVEKNIEAYKLEIERTKKADQEALSIKLFEDFIKKLSV